MRVLRQLVARGAFVVNIDCTVDGTVRGKPLRTGERVTVDLLRDELDRDGEVVLTAAQRFARLIRDGLIVEGI